MRLSSRGRYALRMMLDIARHGDDGRPVSLALVSERTGISRSYLEQLAQSLRAARLVRGVAGRYGGYRIARPTEDITIGQIIEAVIGPVCVVDCIDDPEGCPRVEFCECRPVYDLVNQRIREVLHEFTLADLIRRGSDVLEPGRLPVCDLVGAGSERE